MNVFKGKEARALAEKKKVELFTDGAAGNPGPGGYGADSAVERAGERTVRRGTFHHQQPYGDIRRYCGTVRLETAL